MMKPALRFLTLRTYIVMHRGTDGDSMKCLAATNNLQKSPHWQKNIPCDPKHLLLLMGPRLPLLLAATNGSSMLAIYCLMPVAACLLLPTAASCDYFLLPAAVSCCVLIRSAAFCCLLL